MSKAGSKITIIATIMALSFCAFSCKKTAPVETPKEPADTTKQTEVTKPVDVVAEDTQVTETKDSTDPKLVAIPLVLPKPMFVGTPQNIKGVENLEKPRGKARPPFLAPEGTVCVSTGKTVTGSDEEPIMGDLEMITDGDKEASDGSYVELGPFQQNITIDLEQECEMYAAVVWHFHKQAVVYFDVIMQVSNDPDFITDVTTLFNNDLDNSAGLGVGKDMHYVETSEGKLIDCKGIRGRYVRFYSNGNSANDLNHYIEVEIFGKPVE